MQFQKTDQTNIKIGLNMQFQQTDQTNIKI